VTWYKLLFNPDQKSGFETFAPIRKRCLLHQPTSCVSGSLFGAKSALASRKKSEFRLQSGLFAQFVGGYPINRAMPFDGYCPLVIRVDRMSVAFAQQIKPVFLKILD
jgi:hypothetical protein